MAKKNRKKKYGSVGLAPSRPPRAPRPEPRAVTAERDAGGARLTPVRRRLARAKLALGAAALAAFVIGMLVTRASYAGHSKRPLRSLAAPAGFVRIVRQNLLQAGIVAPAQAPPGAATSVS